MGVGEHSRRGHIDRPSHVTKPLAARAPQLSTRKAWAWYAVAAISYIGAGIWHKALLNWIAGPLWLVVVVVIGPPLRRRVVNGADGR
jgi:hypothetical protein